MASDINTCACFNARSAARAITAFYDRTLEPSGVRTTQFAILLAIREHGALSMQDLARGLTVDPSTLTRMLAPLERQDLVRSEPGEDRRVKELVLTAKGHRAVKDGGPLWNLAQDKLRERLGADRFQRLIEDLGAVTEVLRD